MYHIGLALVLFSATYVRCTTHKENVTDLSKCKVHFSKSDGKYDDFFEVAEKSSKDLAFDFHFLVLAPSDAHVLLTPSKTVKAYADPVYEIVLGAGKNAYSSIRRTMRGDVKATYRYANLLSIFEPRPFWIHVSNDGLIEVGRETQDVAFLSWTDPDPIPLVYFSLGTWPGIEAKWFYDCNKNTIKKVEPVLNDVERLAQNYLRLNESFGIPVLSAVEKLNINMTLKPLIMHLNEMKGRLESRFLMTQKWVDPKLSWFPKDYGGIESLNPHPYQVWTPSIRFFSVFDELERTSVNTKLHLRHDGTVTLAANLHLKTWCNAADLDDWPEDGHVCAFPIGFYVDSNKINLKLVSNVSDLANLEFKTDWDIDGVNQLSFKPENNDQASLEVFFHLKRISIVYKLIYTTPLVVTAVGTLLSFWVSPFGYLKITLACFDLFLITNSTKILVQMALYIPGHPEKVPKILVAYNCGYLGILLSVLLTIVVINISRNSHKYPLPRVLYRTLMNGTLRKVLLLSISKKFTEAPIQKSWILLASFIDRISFVIFVILYGTGMYMYL